MPNRRQSSAPPCIVVSAFAGSGKYVNKTDQLREKVCLEVRYGKSGEKVLTIDENGRMR